MRAAFFRRTIPLIIAGIALGLIARWILGIDVNANSGRRFKQPINPEVLESENETPDILLDDSFDRDVNRS